VKGAAYRITFNRKSGNSTAPNSAFYFTDKEEFEKTKNYFKCLQILEATPQN
jgi:hypothetical protein